MNKIWKRKGCNARRKIDENPGRAATIVGAVYQGLLDLLGGQSHWFGMGRMIWASVASRRGGSTTLASGRAGGAGLTSRLHAELYYASSIDALCTNIHCDVHPYYFGMGWSDFEDHCGKIRVVNFKRLVLYFGK